LIYNDKNLFLVISFIVLAAFTKRAQIPFSSWLPVAIAAPTPVSSLVHSSTLVTAGVYLLIRFNQGLRVSIIFIGLFFSVITIFIAGLGANLEFDLKKIIALSTLSQLGLIITILFVGDYKLTIFHLLIHAFFKALLFICAGLIIHNFIGCQDIRYIGSVTLAIPLTGVIFNISRMSLCGLPFLSGFYSKDLILEFCSFSYLNIFNYVLLNISTGLTASYRLRVFYYLNLSKLKMRLLGVDSGIKILKRKIILIFLVIFIGRCLSWLLFQVPYYIYISLYIKNLTFFIVVIGFILGLEFNKVNYIDLTKSLKGYIYRRFIVKI